MARRKYRYYCPLCFRLKEQGATLTEQSSDVCPECVAIDGEIWKLYHEILKEKPQHSGLTPDELMRKLWIAYKTLEKTTAPK